MGTPEFAAICLRELLNSHHQVIGVVSVADKPAGRGQKISQSAVSKLALEKNLKLFQPQKLKELDFIEELKELNADVFVVVAFRMLPKEIWQLPKMGTFNLHASLLPQYRGAAPINWVIINGETETGVTTFMIDEQIDTGNILLSEKVEILSDENAGDLHDKLVEIGKGLIIKTLNGIENQSIHPQPQENQITLKTAPKIFKEDCKINWRLPIKKIYDFVRGLSPHPISWTYIYKGNEQKLIKIFKGHFDQIPNSEDNIGIISFENNSFQIRLKDGNFYIDELQQEGKKRMKTVDFLNGMHEKTGWRVV